MNWTTVALSLWCAQALWTLVQSLILTREIRRLNAEVESVRASWKRMADQDQVVIEFLSDELKKLRNRTGG